MMKITAFILFLVLITVKLSSQTSIPPDGNKLIKVQMVSDYSSVKSGQDFKLGIILIIEKGWHTYWRNPGDAGLPTTVDFTLPKGVKAGEIIWEEPEKIPFADMANYGYDKICFLTIPMSVAESYKENEIKIDAKISWLVCKEECVPGSKNTSIKINISSDTAVPNKSAMELFKLSETKHSLINPEIITSVTNIEKDSLVLNIELPEYLEGVKKMEFFPYEPGYFNNGAAQNFEISGNQAKLHLKFDKYREKDPAEVYGILVTDKLVTKNAVNKSVEIRVKIK